MGPIASSPTPPPGVAATAALRSVADEAELARPLAEMTMSCFEGIIPEGPAHARVAPRHFGPRLGGVIT
jgi:hypothetical protein